MSGREGGAVSPHGHEGDLEALRQRIDEMESLLASRTVELKRCREEYKTLAYVVSHDLRAPLINLRGFSSELHCAVDALRPALQAGIELLDESQRRQTIVALDEDIPESLVFIRRAVSQIDDFLSAILRLSRASRRVLKFEPVDTAVVVRDVLQSLVGPIAQREVAVMVGSLPEVVADQSALTEIFGVVLTNAIIYLLPERPGEIEIFAEQRADETTFSVRDNGRGVCAADMHKVFEPFRRAGCPDVDGAGIGLPVAQALVRLHGGEMAFTSEPDAGTTVTFSISHDLGKEPIETYD